jgi:hypothetical protein
LGWAIVVRYVDLAFGILELTIRGDASLYHGSIEDTRNILIDQPG